MTLPVDPFVLTPGRSLALTVTVERRDSNDGAVTLHFEVHPEGVMARSG